MPFTPRAANNPIPSAVLLGVVRQIIPAQTWLTQANSADPTGLSVVFIRKRYAMVQQGIFPAVNLSTGPQRFAISSNRSYEGSAIVLVTYYNKWDQSASTIDDIVIRMDADIEAIKANLESNPTLAYGGQAYAVSMPQMHISDDKGEEDSSLGVPLIKRTLTCIFLLLPYDV